MFWIIHLPLPSDEMKENSWKSQVVFKETSIRNLILKGMNKIIVMMQMSSRLEVPIYSLIYNGKVFNFNLENWLVNNLWKVLRDVLTDATKKARKFLFHHLADEIQIRSVLREENVLVVKVGKKVKLLLTSLMSFLTSNAKILRKRFSSELLITSLLIRKDWLIFDTDYVPRTENMSSIRLKIKSRINQHNQKQRRKEMCRGAAKCSWNLIKGRRWKRTIIKVSKWKH